MDNHDGLSKFSRQVPKLLRSQILCELMNNVLSEKRDLNTNKPQENSLMKHHTSPSIQRFHGALLFVDISGFTALSLKLDVDTLKNHINDYFSKMLGIVDKWGGDVVKFAGDALFIIWPTDIHSKETKVNASKTENSTCRVSTTTQQDTIRSSTFRNSLAGNEGKDSLTTTDLRFVVAAKIAVEKAVACGLEICTECSHFEVFLGNGNKDNSYGEMRASPKSGENSVTSLIGKFLPSWFHSNGKDAKILPEQTSTTTDSATAEKKDENIAYLDVHAGVSMGLMAALDIGYKNRWEYFIIGDPVNRAADCESKASKGELVICSRVHHILHAPKKEEGGYLPSLGGDEKGNDEDAHKMDILSIRSSVQFLPSAALPSHSSDASLVAMNQPLPCGCSKLADSCYCITKLDLRIHRDSVHSVSGPPTGDMKLKRSRSKSRLDGLTDDFAGSSSSKLEKDLDIELDKLFTLSESYLKMKFFQLISKYSNKKKHQQEESAHTIESGTALFSAGEHDTSSTGSLVTDLTSLMNEVNPLFRDLCEGKLRDLFYETVKSCLTDDLAKHSHELVRDNYHFEHRLRYGILMKWLERPFVEDPEMIINVETVSKVFQRYNHTNASEKLSLHPMTINDLDGSLIEASPIELKPKLKPQKSQAKLTKALSSRAISHRVVKVAELRTVTVLFMKIDTFESSLMIDPMKGKDGLSVSSSSSSAASSPKSAPLSSLLMKKKNKPEAICHNHFKFLERTENESAADNVLLQKFQDTIQIILESFSLFNGQLRQFIVDDKGMLFSLCTLFHCLSPYYISFLLFLFLFFSFLRNCLYWNFWFKRCCR
jgi:class 3 adenylate cyclase